MEPLKQTQLLTREPAAANVYLFCANALVAHDMASQLRGGGYVVSLFSDFELLRHSIAAVAPTLLIVDWDGAQRASVVAAGLPRWRADCGRHFPILWISASAGFAARLAAARMGADAYFLRPFALGDFFAQVDGLIAARMAQPHRILLAMEDEDEARTTAGWLTAAGMQVQTLDKLGRLFEALDNFRPGMVVLDLNLADCSSADLARLIRQNAAYVDVPIVALGAAGCVQPGEQSAAGWAGIDAVISKPLSAGNFVVSISAIVQRFHALRSLILRDSLTGLYNHAAIKEQLAHELRGNERTQSTLSLAMLDIDFFKKVNDTYGHPVGDQVIGSLSRLLRDRLRGSDVVGRYGGEEFAVILPGAPADAALAMLDVLRQQFFAIVHQAGEAEFCASFSAGVADTTTCHDVETLFRKADAALYEAKRGGRNCIRTA